MVKVTPYLEFDGEAQQLYDRATASTIHLTFSESAILAHLLSVPDAICDKDLLLQVGWPDRVVAATSLTQCVSTLRKKLEPFPEIQLKTVARRGYQLHVSAKSHVTMLAVNDAESIKHALIDVSLMVKVGGIMVLLALIATLWYNSDYHQVVKQAGHWRADKTLDINLGGKTSSLTLIYPNGETQLHPSMWQKHIAPETNHIDAMQDFKGFALTDGNHYSLAICPPDEQGHCMGDHLINLTATGQVPAGLNMVKFNELSEMMENRIRYNRILIPSGDADGDELVEHHYHGDIYFPVANELLVRADMSISMVYDQPLSGKFYSSACITDQDCLTTPIKYQVRGVFEQYRQHIGELEVDVFHVKVLQKDLIKPEVVSPSAMHFYREIRKHNIRDEELFYYRIYNDQGSAVWVVPLLGNLVTWTKYEKVSL
ncbi:winged helix-turn-helix domain-containing protein [Shewanella algidipiscicola]|uniref:CadC family transcriptional regulator n=1 Tax=Shewanella algidipiscicola TaxID=614070 RepID=A0ABQ4P7M8_9GAMM|nr:winged helix-turn-helix domain-containing protein [Shewanella algidipiscicola]GIU43542.1 CadC family transcriptional regulator [Shewanella algidipiscicola]